MKRNGQATSTDTGTAVPGEVWIEVEQGNKVVDAQDLSEKKGGQDGASIITSTCPRI